MDYYLKIKASTWVRDSHGLFDYDTSNIVHESLKIQESGCVFRKGNEIYYDTEYTTPSESHLVQVLENGPEYLICPIKESNIGVVIKDCKIEDHRGYKVFKDDYIKLGKISLKITQTSENIIEVPSNIDECEGSNTTEVICRICFRTHTNSIDPLLSLCNCAGTMALTHLRCFQKWASTKCIKKINSHSITYLWKSLNCDICKQTLPINFVFDDVEYSLIRVPEPTGKFIILEDFRRDKYQCIFHVLTPEFAPVTIGRNNDCDLQIKDVSVSRSHAVIHYYENNFYLADNFSKFGTTVQIRHPLCVKVDRPIAIQANRSHFAITLKRQSRVLQCFACCNKKIAVHPLPRGRTEIPIEEQSLHSPGSIYNE